MITEVEYSMADIRAMSDEVRMSEFKRLWDLSFPPGTLVYFPDEENHPGWDQEYRGENE